MREIKFRAWDRDKKEMMRVNELTLDAQFEAGWSFMAPYSFDEYWKSKDPRERKYTNFPPYTNHVVLMQATGLPDKNGKEIYEGDIVRCEPNEWLETVGVIKYVICEFVVEQEKPRLHHRIVNGMKGKLEIIGNIYENPELLQESTRSTTESTQPQETTGDPDPLTI